MSHQKTSAARPSVPDTVQDRVPCRRPNARAQPTRASSKPPETWVRKSWTHLNSALFVKSLLTGANLSGTGCDIPAVLLILNVLYCADMCLFLTMRRLVSEPESWSQFMLMQWGHIWNSPSTKTMSINTMSITRYEQIHYFALFLIRIISLLFCFNFFFLNYRLHWWP